MKLIFKKTVVFVLSLSLFFGVFINLSNHEEVRAQELNAETLNGKSEEINDDNIDKTLLELRKQNLKNKEKYKENNEGKNNYGHISLPFEDDIPVSNSSLSYDLALRRIYDNPQNSKLNLVRDGEQLPSAYPYNYTDTENLIKYFNEKLTPVKDQGNFGMCWTFAAISAIENTILHNNLSDKDGQVSRNTLDYSELQLAYFTYHNSLNPIILDQEFDKTYISEGISFTQAGGNPTYIIENLTRWRGPVKESLVPYSNVQNYYYNNDFMRADGIISEEYAYKNNSIYINNAYYINANYNREQLKQAIKTHGAATSRIYMDYEFYSYDYNSYLSNKSYINHDVCIVGWDDNYPKENFINKPENNGAWLVRNSWMDGNNPGSDSLLSIKGYFWISYEEPTLNYAIVYEAENFDDYINKYDNNYYYTNSIYDYGSCSDIDKVANVFTVAGEKGYEKETINAVGLHFTDSDVNYSVSIYSVDEEGRPDKPIHEGYTPTSGTIPFMGYYTIQLTEPVILNKGDKFAVVVTEGASSIVAELCNDYYETIKLTPGINPGESFVYELDDETYDFNWYDLYEYGFDGFGNFCIQALTKDTGSPVTRVEGVKRDSTNSNAQAIYLTWDSFTNASGYYIYRSEESYDFSDAVKFSSTNNYYLDNGLEPNSKHYYKVVPIINGVESVANTSKTIEAAVKPSENLKLIPDITFHGDNYMSGYYGYGADGCLLKYRKKGTESTWKNLIQYYDKNTYSTEDGVTYYFDDNWYAYYNDTDKGGLYEVQITPYFFNLHRERGYGQTVTRDFIKPYDAPKNFNAVYNEETSIITFTWDSVDDATQYRLRDYGHFDEIVTGTSYEYKLTDFEPLTQYNYYVEVYDESLEDIAKEFDQYYAHYCMASIITPRVKADAKIFKLSESTKSVMYNGQNQAAVIDPIYKPVSGGAVTVYYKPADDENAPFSTDIPVDAGKYNLKIDVAESDLYYSETGITDASWIYEILPAEIIVLPDSVKKDYDKQAELTFTYKGNVSGEFPAFIGALSVEEDAGRQWIALGSLALVDNAAFKAKNYVLKLSDEIVYLAILGDTNNDGAVTTDDVIYLKHYLAGGYNVTVTLQSADIDMDGLITPMDVTLLERSLAQNGKSAA